jgi:hypothetical protein
MEKMHNDEICSLYSSLNIIRLIIVLLYTWVYATCSVHLLTSPCSASHTPANLKNFQLQ